MLFRIPDKHAINPRSGQPEAPDSWRFDQFMIWCSRAMAAIAVISALMQYSRSSITQTVTFLVIALVVVLFSEIQAAILRKRRAALELALAAYVRMLEKAEF